jgi:hypothetical protein
VLEAELLPGEGALLAPEWVPWAVRLAEYQAAQAALAAERGVEAEDAADADDDSDEDLDDDDLDDVDDLDAADFDDDGSPILHAGDVDGVDIDVLDDDTEDDDADDGRGRRRGLAAFRSRRGARSTTGRQNATVNRADCRPPRATPRSSPSWTACRCSGCSSPMRSISGRPRVRDRGHRRGRAGPAAVTAG